MSQLVAPSPVRGIAPWVKVVRERPAHEVVGRSGSLRPAITSPDDAYRLLAGLEVEEAEIFVVLMLDVKRRVIAREIVSRGLVDHALVHPREVFRLAIAYGASSIVVAHNHPSGDPSPSDADREVTRTLVAAGRLLDIPVDDHVIVGAGSYVSFLAAGLL